MLCTARTTKGGLDEASKEMDSESTPAKEVRVTGDAITLASSCVAKPDAKISTRSWSKHSPKVLFTHHQTSADRLTGQHIGYLTLTATRYDLVILRIHVIASTHLAHIDLGGVNHSFTTLLSSLRPQFRVSHHGFHITAPFVELISNLAPKPIARLRRPLWPLSAPMRQSRQWKSYRQGMEVESSSMQWSLPTLVYPRERQVYQKPGPESTVY